MDALDGLTKILGWCSAINFGMLMVSFLGILALGDLAYASYQMMFGLAEEETRLLIISVILQFEVLILVFNFIPYIALKIVNRPVPT